MMQHKKEREEGNPKRTKRDIYARRRKKKTW